MPELVECFIWRMWSPLNLESCLLGHALALNLLGNASGGPIAEVTNASVRQAKAGWGRAIPWHLLPHDDASSSPKLTMKSRVAVLATEAKVLCELNDKIGLRSHTVVGRKFVLLLQLLLNTWQTPFPLRLFHPVLCPEHYCSIILFPRIDSFLR